jgi:hypothetical protein
MENGTAYNFRHHSAAQRRKATFAAQKYSKLHGRACKGKGCLPNKKGYAAIRPDSHVANGFLKCSFMPKLEGKAMHDNDSEAEAEFYNSVSLLCNHYDITPMATRFLGYPYNAAIALWDIREQLIAKRSDSVFVEIVKTNSGTVNLATKENFDSNYSLFYIPVLPLYYLLKDKEHTKAGQVLLSVFAYLYQIAEVPYYREKSSYLHDQYFYIKEWIEGDPDDWGEDYEANSAELKDAARIGDSMKHRIGRCSHLQQFEKRLGDFWVRDTFDLECHAVAQEFLHLWKTYPEHTIMTHAPHLLGDDEDVYNTYYGETIAMYQYISFSATTKGWLYKTIAENVNNEFNECSEIEEPTLRKVFDGGNLGNLDFELRLFPAIDRLCSLLDEIDYGNT